MASKVKNRKFTSADFAQLGAVLVFIIQAGAATVRQIKDTLKKLGAEVHWRTLENTLENVRGRSLLVKESRSNDEGHMEAHYRVARVKYAKATVEVAHIKDLIPIILADPAGQEIMEELNAFESGVDPNKLDAGDDADKDSEKGNGKGNGKTTKGEKNKMLADSRTWYKDYVRFWIKWRLLECIYGSQPLKKGANKLLVKSYFDSDFQNPDLPSTQKELEGLDPEPLLFERDLKGGSLKIHRAAVRGWLRGVLRVNNVRESVAEVTSTRSIFIRPEADQMTTVIHPIQAGPNSREKGTGLGLATYEVLVPGVEFQMIVDFPCADLTPQQVCDILRDGAQNNPRCLSPARGTQTGQMEMVSCHARKKSLKGKENIQELYLNGDTEIDLGQDEVPA